LVKEKGKVMDNQELDVIEYGKVTSPAAAGTNVLNDNTKNWAVDVHRNRLVRIFKGAGSGQLFPLQGNGPQALVIRGTWTLPLDTTSEYEILSFDLAQVIRDVLGGGVDVDLPAEFTAIIAAIGGATAATDIIDRWARQLGQIDIARVLGVALAHANPLIARLTDGAVFIDPRDMSDRAARLLGIIYGSVGQLQQRAVSGDIYAQLRSAGVEIDPRDVSDRAARLLGIVYGSQAQQLLQRAATFDLLIQLRHNGVEIDPTAIRALTAADIVTVQSLTQWGGVPLTGRDISLDLKALTDDSIKGILKSIGDIAALENLITRIGQTTDAIVAAGATGSISAKLRRVTQGLEDLETLISLTQLPAALTASGNLKVAIQELAAATVASEATLVKLIPIAKAALFNTALPAAEANWLGSDITPTNSPSYLRIYACVSVAGILRVARTIGGTTLTENLNSGNNLVAGAAYMFTVPWRSGDSINIRYSVTTGTINRLLVDEIGGAE
jgi:hypothetical protein